MKWFILTLFVFTTLISFPLSSYAQRYAECDACGYCIGRDIPESWIDCRNCLYPDVAAHDGQAISNETLEIITDPADPRLDPTKKALNQPVPPAKGKYFTQLGCVDTSLSSFSDPGAAGGVLNFILTKLIFPATGVLAFGTLIYGSFLLVTAQGAEMQIATGKRYITGSIVGLIFTFSIVLIVNIVGSDVLRIPGFGKGTRVTFVGYGTATSENGVLTYPRIVLQYDGQDIDAIKSLEGSASQQQEYTFYLPVEIDITRQSDVNKVTFLFDNDLCISCDSTLADATHFGDRDIFNTRILFDDTACAERTLLNESNPTYRGPFDDTDVLTNKWPEKPIQCSLIQ